MTKALWRLLGFAIFVVPLGLLTVFASSYFLDCLQLLSAPGTNLSVPIETEAGTLTLRAKSYAVEPIQGVVSGNDIGIFDSAGNELARAKAIRVKAPHYFNLSDSSIDLYVTGAYAVLERNERGEFPILRYFETKEPTRKTIPFGAFIRDSEILFKDRYGKAPFAERILIESATGAGTTDAFLASGSLRTLSGGSTLSVQRTLSGKWAFSGRLESVQLGRLFEHAKSLPDTLPGDAVKDWTVGSAIASGPFQVEFEPDKQWSLFSEPNVTFEGAKGPYWDRAARGTYSGKMTESGISGVVALADGSGQATFGGWATWADGIRTQGRLLAKLPSLQSIPSKWRSSLPEELSASGLSFEGPVLFSDENGLRASGAVRVTMIRYQQESLANAEIQATISGKEVVARVNGLKWREVPVQAAVRMAFDGNTVSGFAQAKDIDLGRTFKDYLDRPISGFGSVRVALGGTLSKPTADIRAVGDVAGDLFGEGTQRFGTFDAAGTYAGDLVKVSRLTLAGRGGLLIATGDVDVRRKQLNLELTGTGIEIGQWLDDWSGIGTAKLNVVGPLNNPKATGRLEIFGGAYQDESIPIVAANLQIDKAGLVATGISGLRGASRLDGELTVNFKDKSLKGAFDGKALQLGDFFGSQVAGSLNVDHLTIGGSFDAPLAVAEVSGRDIVVGDIQIDTVDGKATLADDLITVPNLEIGVDEGGWNGEGWFNLTTKSGSLLGSGRQLSLEKLVPVLPGETLLSGEVSATTAARWTDGKLTEANIAGNLEQFSVKPVDLGQGSFVLRSDGSKWSGNVELGNTDRYIQVPEFNYFIESEEIEAQLVTLDVRLRNVYGVLRNRLSAEGSEGRPVVSDEILRFLDNVDAGIDMSVVVQGSIKDPDVVVETASIRESTISGEGAGTFQLTGSRKSGGLWSIQDLSWSGASGVASIKGTLQEGGELDLSGQLNNFEPRWLAIFDERLVKVSGVASVPLFEATGPVSSPTITAALDISLFEEPRKEGESGPRDYHFNAAIGPIKIEDGLATFEGDFNVSGISGGVEGEIPFQFPAAVPAGEDLSVRVSVPKSRRRSDGSYEQGFLNLKEHSKDWSALKLGGETNTLRASIELYGPTDALKVKGDVRADIDELSHERLATKLDDIRINATLAENRVRLTTTAAGGIANSTGKQGTLSALLNVELGDLIDRMQGDAEDWLRTPVSGHVDVQGIHIKEFDKETGGALDVEASGELRVGGTVGQPLISTIIPVAIQNLSATMPSEFVTGEQPVALKIDPKFSIGYVIARRNKPANIKASTSSFDIYGAGSLTGSLSAVTANANLTVRDGNIRLPNARIAIEDGGSVRFLYRGSAERAGDLRLDVDLIGQTNLSSVRLGGFVQRYDIDLNIRGNLLDPESQVFTARSDPPDLTSQQILNILGQQELFESLASQFLGERSDSQLVGALAGFAIPAVFDPFTAQVARELGLEFIQLEYNAYEGATVTAAKVLEKGLVFQGRRQLSETFDNIIRFDYRLTWRPPSKFRDFRNLIFSIGADQDRPWKISVEYGIRF